MGRLPAQTHKTGNWPAHQEALRRRGSLKIWFDPAMSWDAPPTGNRGRKPVFFGAASSVRLTLKAHFRLALRQTTGMVAKLLDPAGLH